MQQVLETVFAFFPQSNYKITYDFITEQSTLCGEKFVLFCDCVSKKKNTYLSGEHAAVSR